MICTVVYGGIGLFRQAHSDLIVNIFDMSEVIRFWIPFISYVDGMIGTSATCCHIYTCMTNGIMLQKKSTWYGRVKGLTFFLFAEASVDWWWWPSPPHPLRYCCG